MSILILGVIFAVGLIALVGAAFLVLGEGQTEATPRAGRTPLEAIPAPAPTGSMSSDGLSAARPTIRLPDEDALASSRSGSSVPSRPSGSLSRENLAKPREEELRVRLNGQFHELAEELGSLHQQVGAFEQRLGSLHELVAHLTQASNEHVLLEDPTQSLPGFPVE